MKRVICILLILCLVPVFSVAESFGHIIDLYNGMAENLGIQKLPEEYTTEVAEEGNEKKIYVVSDTIRVIFDTKSNDVFSFSAACLSSDSYIDFIPVCLSGSFALNPDDFSSIVTGMILQFYSVRSGKESEHGNATNCVYDVLGLGNDRIGFVIVLK